MNVTATNEPCMILETVELLYAFVNELPAGELTAPGPYTIPSSELQHMMASATEGISRQDPAMQFFFLKEPLQDGSGLFTCLARAVVYNTMDFSCKTLGASFDTLRRNWQELRQRGEHISAIGEFGMDYMEQEDRSFVPLSVDLERLEVTPEYRQKLLEVFSGFETYTAILEKMLEPVATRLEALLRPWALRAEPLARSWEARYREGNAVEILQKRACCNAGSSVQALFINLRYLQPTAAPGVLDDEARTVFFHTGVAQETERKEPLDFEDWEYHALRLLGSPARMRMLQAMAEKPMSSREMAQQLDLHLGAVGRDVKSLFDARLLLLESVQGRNRYKTNFASIETIMQHLKSLQKKGSNES